MLPNSPAARPSRRGLACALEQGAAHGTAAHGRGADIAPIGLAPAQRRSTTEEALVGHAEQLGGPCEGGAPGTRQTDADDDRREHARGVGQIGRVVAHVAVQVGVARGEARRVLGQEPAADRVVVAGAVEGEPRGVVLAPGEPGRVS